MLEKLPQPLLDAVANAAAKIGAERAVIALQGIVHASYPQRIIDGTLRQETIDGVNHILKTNKIEAIAAPFIEKIETRFPGTFEFDEDDADVAIYDARKAELDEESAEVVEDEDLVPVISPRRKKKTDG